MQKDGGIPNKLVLPHVIAILTNICTDSSIRQKLTCHDDIWQFCASVLVSADSSSGPIVLMSLVTDKPVPAVYCYF